MFEQLGLIGCGLMGGSFALALKRAGLVKRVVGYSKSPSTTQRALSMGVIDVEAPSALLAVSGADVVLLAVPVAATEATLKAIRHLASKDMLIMDVGSTKTDVIDAARRVLREHIGSFVPCHPITGKEVSGVENADPDLYSGRQVIITPIERTSPQQCAKAVQLWKTLGCDVSQMTPEAHDAAFAAVSHLPHLIAFALVQAIAAEWRRAPGTGWARLSRLHPHCGIRLQDLARHPDRKPQRTAGAVEDLPAHLASHGSDDRKRQRRSPGRPDQPGQRGPRQLAHGLIFEVSRR
jgi:prephenate dehydrogenase